MKKHTALQAAQWFLSHNRMMEDDYGAESLSNLKLNYLLYYAQGAFLSIMENPLFDEDIVAGEQGPVVESVNRKYKRFGAEGIDFEKDFPLDSYTETEDALLAEIYDAFGQFSAWKLRNMTREERPWKNTGRNCIIENEEIKRYFENQYIDPEGRGIDTVDVLPKEEYDSEEDLIWE